ncbi:MAG: hypothetical protein HC857_16685 [Synechococcales cyanobacterium RU_4_20]|nr:hypothetical protein [Synechococcales cyanobacterium RU_4_20]
MQRLQVRQAEGRSRPRSRSISPSLKSMLAVVGVGLVVAALTQALGLSGQAGLAMA